MQTLNIKMLKFYFVLQISDSFVDQNKFKEILKKKDYINDEQKYSLINSQNYSKWRSII